VSSGRFVETENKLEKVTREQTLAALQEGWAAYVNRFHALSPKAQTEFLKKQGFSRFADMLAHVTAWWEEGEQVINGILGDPDYRWTTHDVDTFNARAVERFSGLDEVVVVSSYELARISFAVLVSSLPEGAFTNKKITSWLYADVIEHLQDHDIP
jgi:hypothetical protein